MTKHTKQQAGSKGGRVTVARHGREHMQSIGRKGAATFWQRYTFTPAGLNDFAIRRRDNGETIAFLSGKPWEER